MGHLGYRSLLKLIKLIHKIKIKGPTSIKIYGRYIKNRLQQKPSQTPIISAMKFLEEIHNNLKKPLFLTRWRKQYYISFYNNTTGTYHVKIKWHKSQALEKFLELISWAENQLEKTMKKY